LPKRRAVLFGIQHLQCVCCNTKLLLAAVVSQLLHFALHSAPKSILTMSPTAAKTLAYQIESALRLNAAFVGHSLNTALSMLFGMPVSAVGCVL